MDEVWDEENAHDYADEQENGQEPQGQMDPNVALMFYRAYVQLQYQHAMQMQRQNALVLLHLANEQENGQEPQAQIDPNVAVTFYRAYVQLQHQHAMHMHQQNAQVLFRLAGVCSTNAQDTHQLRDGPNILAENEPRQQSTETPATNTSNAIRLGARQSESGNQNPPGNQPPQMPTAGNPSTRLTSNDQIPFRFPPVNQSPQMPTSVNPSTSANTSRLTVNDQIPFRFPPVNQPPQMPTAGNPSTNANTLRHNGLAAQRSLDSGPAWFGVFDRRGRPRGDEEEEAGADTRNVRARTGDNQSE